MNLSGYKKDYYELSGLASTACRQLAFAGIALIWIFKSGESSSICLPDSLLIPAGLLVLSLTFDMLQYVVGATVWGFFHRYHEKRKENPESDPYVLAKPIYNWPANSFFYLKILSVVSAYFLLLKFVVNAISFV